MPPSSSLTGKRSIHNAYDTRMKPSSVMQAAVDSFKNPPLINVAQNIVENCKLNDLRVVCVCGTKLHSRHKVPLT